MWFYLEYALKELLHLSLIEHFDQFSRATYILFETRITQTEVLLANDMLNRFADYFEIYYGKNAVTINVHLLRHYANVVMNTGPLWCHSLFTFESNIGEVKRLFCGTVDVVEQIAFNYCMKRSAETENSRILSNIRILRPKSKSIPKEVENILCDFKKPDGKYIVGFELFWKKKEIIKSISSFTGRSIDHFIEIYDGTIGVVQMFIDITGTPHVVIQEYLIISSSHHIKQVEKTNNLRLYNCNEIRRKLIYLKFNYANISFKEIITSEPNSYEGT